MSLGPVLSSVLWPPVGDGVGASAYASGPAPAGYYWDFVTENGLRVTENGEPVVSLVRSN